MSDSKITIDVDLNIDPNALKQIPQLTTALDSLRGSVGNLNKEVITFNKQNQETVTWGTKAKSTVKDLTDTYDSFNKLIDIAAKGLKGWSGILSGIFTLVTTYGPQILEFFNNFLDSDKAKAAAKALKDYKDIMTGYVENVSAEISKKEMLLNMANDDKIGRENQIEAIKKLNALSPEYLQHLTLKNLKTKEGKEMIDEYTKALKRQAMEEAVHDKRADKVKARYDLKEKVEAAKKIWQETPNSIQYRSRQGNDLTMHVEAYNPKDEAGAKFKDLLDQDHQLLVEIKQHDADLAKSLLKYAPKEAQKPKNKHQKALTNISAPRSMEYLEGKSIDLAKSLQDDQKHYDEETAMLDQQWEKKLITEEKYQQQSEALQEKYQSAIGQKIKAFHLTDLDEVKKHLENLAIIQGHYETMADDEHNLKKAILPADHLKAEQTLIDHKYAYEIALAEGNKEKIKQLEEEKEKEKTEIAQRYEEQRKAFALQTAQKVSDTAFSILKGNIQSQADAKIKGLETQKQAELNNSSLTATQKRAIEDKYKKKEAEEKVKAFKAEQRASILQAVINGALAITKATSQTGVLAPFVIPGIIVETALQVATIAKQKAPQYAKGGVHYQSDGRGALLSGYSRTDDTNAYLRSGEAVVVSEAMRNPWARNLVSAINVAHGGMDFSVGNPGRGYAIGGIFTDGGNANRYYSAPANDAKDLANTLAYQMINNFPPIYVDVKDVNNQQNILAQTVNRVNL